MSCSAVADDNAVIFRIVDGECPPILGRSSGPLIALLKEYFHEEPEMRLSAEKLFDHEWLKNHSGLNKVSLARAIVAYLNFVKDLRLQDSIPSLRRVSASLLKNGVARYLIANLEFDSPDLPKGNMAMLLSSSPAIDLSQTRNTSPFWSRKPMPTSLEYTNIPLSKRPLAVRSHHQRMI